jgi:hypothetical protein
VYPAIIGIALPACFRVLPRIAMRMRFAMVVGLVMLVGCGEDEVEGGAPAGDAERLFAVGSSDAKNESSVEGVWETRSPRIQSGLESMIRVELRADRMVAAVRCTPSAGGDATLLGKGARAVVSATSIDVPEEVRVSKPIGSSYCGVVFRAGTLPTCDVRLPPSERKSCFELSKGVLVVREDIASVEYVKVSD